MGVFDMFSVAITALDLIRGWIKDVDGLSRTQQRFQAPRIDLQRRNCLKILAFIPPSKLFRRTSTIFIPYVHHHLSVGGIYPLDPRPLII